MNTKEVYLSAKEKRSRFFEKYGLLLILLGMCLIMTLLKPEFLTYRNLSNILRQQTPIAIMSLGVTFTIISGGIDVSGGSVIALCSVICASLAHPAANGSGAGEFPFIVTLLTPILAGGALGTLNGLVISLGRIPPFIATLGMMATARGLALIISDGKPINGFTEHFNYIGRGVLFGVPFPIYILAFAAIIAYIILHKTKFGVSVFSIGSNETAAVVSGVNVKRNKTLVYTLAGALTGIAAIVLTSRTLAGQPASGVGYEMDAITGAVIGGTSFAGGIGTIVGTIIGAIIMGILSNGMTMLQIDPSLQQVVKGLVIVGAVLLDERKHHFLSK